MSEETIFREVDEELRGDRMRNFWRRFGPWVIGAAVLVVLAVAANEGWRYWQNSNSARSSDQFYAALDAAEKNDMAGAQTALDQVIASGTGGYPTLAKFREAALLVHKGDTQGAIAAYDALANGESNAHLRELALLFAANLLVDNGDVAAVQQRVGGLATPDNPMRNSAREAIGLTQYKAGDLDTALQTFTDIAADPLSGTDQQQRLRIYIAQLTAMGAQTAAQKAAATAAATGTAASAANAAPAAGAPAPATANPAAATPAAPAETAAVPAAVTPMTMEAAPQGAAPAVPMQAAPSAGPQPAGGVEPASPVPSAPMIQPAPAGSTPAAPMKPLPQSGG